MSTKTETKLARLKRQRKMLSKYDDAASKQQLAMVEAEISRIATPTLPMGPMVGDPITEGQLRQLKWLTDNKERLRQLHHLGQRQVLHERLILVVGSFLRADDVYDAKMEKALVARGFDYSQVALELKKKSQRKAEVLGVLTRLNDSKELKKS